MLLTSNIIIINKLLLKNVNTLRSRYFHQYHITLNLYKDYLVIITNDVF